jgi:hypothetical protein
VTARCLLALIAFAGCGERSAGELTASAGASSSASASGATTAASERATASAPPPASPTASAAASASSRPTDGSTIAAFLDDAEANVEKWNYAPFAIEGVFLRSWLHQSGVYVGGEHPGFRIHVVNVADESGAAPRDTLQCWTGLLAAPTDLKAGDRIRVEGTVSHLAGHAGRRYLPHLSGCTYTRL